MPMCSQRNIAARCELREGHPERLSIRHSIVSDDLRVPLVRRTSSCSYSANNPMSPVLRDAKARLTVIRPSRARTATRRGHGNLQPEIVKSGARSRAALAHPRLALLRADRRIGLPHQTARLVFLRGFWRGLLGLGLGSRERHRLRTSLNHLRRLAWHASPGARPGLDIADEVRRLEHVPPRLNQGDSRGAKDGRVYRH